uniref:Condensin-2 complex subunit G2 n=1 Tax=Kalanchoe fedtschenkoi TaxID=63787 RepID=A0A7N0V790_KALFE
MEKALRSALQSSAEAFISSAAKLGFRSAKSALKPLIHSVKPSSDVSASLPLALRASISHSIDSLHRPQHLSPPSKRLRFSAPPDGLLSELQVLAHIALLCVSHPRDVFSPGDLYPAVKLLHDNLLLFESDPVLLAEICSVCEEWWKRDLPERESVISLFLPVLLSKSLTDNKKVDVHKIFSLREAFELFDFEDESIEDLKLLLMRAVIAPVYWKAEDGRKFIASMFGLNMQLMKDIFAMIKAQVPFGKKSMLDAYGEILFRAWKVAEEDKREEIENQFVQSLIESAILASSSSLSASIRRILGGFVNQRTSEGVEKLLYRLAEPIVFRSLQVANSNVRLNALHLLLDFFPLEDPDSTKDVKDVLHNKQFFLIEKLLKDDCPDVRVVAVEGSCRILHLFWEIIPSSTITKIIVKILDDMSYDANKEVRLSSVNGIIFLLGNPQTHELLKVLLSRIGHLLFDPVLSVRAAFSDLLLFIRDIRSFPFNKVVDLDKLLLALATDQPAVAQKVTRLLIPSYFPSKVTVEEACARCVILMRREPKAGARFCEFIVAEEVSLRSLLQLVSGFVDMVLSPKQLNTEQTDCLMVGAAYLCNHLARDAANKASLKALFSDGKLKQLIAVLSTGRAKSALFSIVSAVSVDAAADIVKESIRLITKCCDLSEDMERQAEARSIHKFLLHCGQFDELLDVVATILHKTALGCHAGFCTNISIHKRPTASRNKSKSSRKESANHLTSKKDFSLAAGLAWQIKEMLLPEDIRKALLESRHLKMIFFALKDICEANIMQFLDFAFMESSPITAYTALAMHITLHNVQISGTSATGHLVGTQNDSRSETSSQQAMLDETIDHVICLAEKLLKALGIVNFDDLSSGKLDNCSKIHHLGQQCMREIVNTFTSVLKFIADAMSMQLLSCNPVRCVNTALGHTQYIAMLIRQGIKDEFQPKEDNLNATLMCLKSSCTYVMKILNQVLIGNKEGSPPAAEASHLSNNLLDLILSVEMNLGSSCAWQLFTAVKPWVTDLVLTLAYEHIVDTKLGNRPSISLNSRQNVLLWHSIVAEIELREVDEGSMETQTTELLKKTHKFSASKKLIAMIVESILGNSNVMDAFGVNLLSSVLVAIERKEFGIVLGILHFVCAKLAGQHESIWGELNLMLPSMIRIYSELDREIEDLGNDEEERQKLILAKALIKPVWIYYTYEMDKGGDESAEPMVD